MKHGIKRAVTAIKAELLHDVPLAYTTPSGILSYYQMLCLGLPGIGINPWPKAAAC